MSICLPPRELVAASSAAPSAPRTAWLPLAAAAVLATVVPAALGLYRLSMPSLWFDEAVTWFGTAGSWSASWQEAVGGQDCGGFLYSTFMKLWTAAFGVSEFALRLPSVLFAVGTAWSLLQLGRGLGSLRAGVFMALLVAVHPESICWSRQARAYELELFLTALFLALFAEYDRRGTRTLGFWIALVGGLLGVTHIFGVFVVVGAGGYLSARHLLAANTDGSPLSLRPLFVPALCVAWWAWTMRARVDRNLDDFWLHGTMARGYWDVLLALAPCFPFTPLCLTAALWKGRGADVSPSERRLLLLVGAAAAAVLVGPAVASLLSRGGQHFVLPRYCIPGVVPVAVLLGWYFARWSPLVGGAAVVASALMWSGWTDVARHYTPFSYDGGDTRAAVQLLKRHETPQDRVYVLPEYQRVVSAYYGVPFAKLLDPGHPGDERGAIRAVVNEAAAAEYPVRLFVYGRPAIDALNGLDLKGASQHRFGLLSVLQWQPQSAAAP